MTRLPGHCAPRSPPRGGLSSRFCFADVARHRQPASSLSGETSGAEFADRPARSEASPERERRVVAGRQGAERAGGGRSEAGALSCREGGQAVLRSSPARCHSPPSVPAGAGLLAMTLGSRGVRQERQGGSDVGPAAALPVVDPPYRLARAVSQRECRTIGACGAGRGTCGGSRRSASRPCSRRRAAAAAEEEAAAARVRRRPSSPSR